MTQLNKKTYAELIEQDIEYLMKQERTLERDHIISVLRDSIRKFYSAPKAFGILKNLEPLTMCQAATDGDCIHPNCPQNRDGEPMKSGRHCPLPHWSDDENY
jgi:hypothetical protein